MGELLLWGNDLTHFTDPSLVQPLLKYQGTIQHFWGLLTMVQNLRVFYTERIPIWLHPCWKQQKSRCANKCVRPLMVYLSVVPSRNRHQLFYTAHSPQRSAAKIHHVMQHVMSQQLTQNLTAIQTHDHFYNGLIISVRSRWIHIKYLLHHKDGTNEWTVKTHLKSILIN